MDIRTHAHLLRTSIWFLVLTTIVCAVAGFAYAFTRPVVNTASMSFQVEYVNRPEAQDYRYGGYYEQKGSEMYTLHVMSLFQSPSIVARIYEQADLPTDDLSAGDIVQRFHVRQHSNQHFVVDFGDRERGVVEQIAAGVTSVVQENVAQSGSINGVPQYRVEPAGVFYAESRRNPWMATVAGALIGFLGSVALVYIREYLRT
jgi:capsular polysaccharide biosynthesis protein